MLPYNEELPRFIEEFSAIQKRLDILERLQRVEDYRQAIISTGSKKGFTAYKKWRLDQLDILNQTREKKQKKTAFQKAVESSTEKTLFEKFKGG